MEDGEVCESLDKNAELGNESPTHPSHSGGGMVRGGPFECGNSGAALPVPVSQGCVVPVSPNSSNKQNRLVTSVSIRLLHIREEVTSLPVCNTACR